MQSSRVERPEQLTLEVGRFSASVTSIAVTIVFVLVVGMLANSVRKNNDRADDWRRRAVAAEEVVGGLRVVLAERSQALNQRTRQANELVADVASSRGALRETKVSVGALTQRQRQLASEYARAETERRKLQAQRAALASVCVGLECVQPGSRDDRRRGPARKAEGGARNGRAAGRAVQPRTRASEHGPGALGVIRAAALGLTLFLTILLAGCGLVVTDAAPTDVVQVSAPGLVEPFPEVEAFSPAPARTLSLGRRGRVARRAALQVLIPACDDDDTARGFALGPHTLVAHRDLVEGDGWVRVWTANRRSTAVGAASAYRVGELGVARVARPLPRRLPLALTVASGASVVVVAERGGKLRMLPGVVVDSVPGAPFGARTKVVRVTSDVREGDAGPVLDAKGRIVGVVFGVDSRTTLGLAVPVAALRGRSVGRALEALEPCD